MENKFESESHDPSNLPPLLNWPKINWRFEYYIALSSGLFTAISFAFPSLSNSSFDAIRFIVVFLSFLIFLIPAISWAFGLRKIASSRIKLYPVAQIKATNFFGEREFLEKKLTELQIYFLEKNSYEIIRASYIDKRLYIALKNKRSNILKVGNELTVIHTQDFRQMGEFEVSEIKSGQTLAKSIRNIDPLWLGHVRGIGEITLIPNMVAIFAETEEK